MGFVPLATRVRRDLLGVPAEGEVIGTIMFDLDRLAPQAQEELKIT
jgi:hypothetical protein